MLVVACDIALDAGDELAHISEGSMSDSPLRDHAKPTLHLIEPARISRREVHVIARVFRQPYLDLRVLMRSYRQSDARRDPRELLDQHASERPETPDAGDATCIVR